MAARSVALFAEGNLVGYRAPFSANRARSGSSINRFKIPRLVPTRYRNIDIAANFENEGKQQQAKKPRPAISIAGGKTSHDKTKAFRKV